MAHNAAQSETAPRGEEMRIHVGRTLVLVLIMTVLSAFCSWAEVKIGILAQRGKDEAVKEWSGLTEYLSDKVGEKFVLVPLSFTEFRDFYVTEKSGFIFANPWFYVRAKVRRGAHAIVTARYQHSGSMFGGVIFTRNDSGIVELNDLRGKLVLVPKLSSVGGWLFQKGVFVQNGITPEKDFKQLKETDKESQDEVVYAVRDGKVDAGTVRTNILETMQRQGKINLADFRIIHPVQHPNFPEFCSTPLYPDWPVAALKDTSPSLVEKVKQELISIPQGHESLERARKLERFVDALDYAPLEELCKYLNVEPFRIQELKQ